jgi:hemolysin III
VAAYLAAPAALALWAYAPASAQTATAIYGLTLVLLFAMSATYHRPTWSPRQRDVIGRLDHAAIFLLIAGTYTPFGVMLGPGDGHTLLTVVWVGALLGLGLSVGWPSAPKWLMAGVFVLLGWSNVPVLPAMFRGLGAAVMVLVLLGGLIYTVGALVYARKRPDPFPAVFGYHEIFHLFVIAAAVVHFVAVAGALRAVSASAPTASAAQRGVVIEGSAR